jgi:O-antigen ligase
MSKTNIICRSIILLLVVVTPLYYGSVDWWVIYLIETSVLFAVFLWFWGMIQKGRIHIHRLAPIPYLGLFLLLCLFSFWQTDYKWVGRRELLLYLTGTGVYFLVAHLFNRIRYLQLLNKTLLILGTTLSLVGILQYFGVLVHPWWLGYKLSATFVNKNHFAGYINMIIPFAITRIYLNREAGKRMLVVYCLIVMFLTILLTFSRGGWISLLLSSTFLCLVLIDPQKKKLKWAAASFFLVPIAFLLFADVGVKNIENISKPEGSYAYKRQGEINIPVRRRIYRSTVSMIEDHWVLGCGPGSFATVFPRYRVAGLDFRVDYAHNDYLQIAAELGLAALPLLFLIIWSTLKAAWIKARSATSETEKGTTLAAMAGIIAILAHSALDFNLHIPANAFLFMVLLALASARPVSKRKNDDLNNYPY